MTSYVASGGERQTIDAWAMVKHIDGYDIEIKSIPPKLSENKLYFLNLDGYDHSQFTELHKNILVVSDRESKAKIKGLKQILDWQSPIRSRSNFEY